MPSLAELQNHMESRIRKGLQGSVFIKRYADGDPTIDALQDATGLLAIPTGYVDIGRIDKEQGLVWSRATENSDVMSLGASQPTRSDVVSDVVSLQFTPQESWRTTIEMHEGLELGSTTFDATNNLYYDKPDRPRQDFWRAFALFKDGDGVDALYMAKWLPKAKVQDPGEQSWKEGDPVTYPMTLQGFKDPDVGTSLRTLWAGPAARLTEMGFTAAV